MPPTQTRARLDTAAGVGALSYLVRAAGLGYDRPRLERLLEQAWTGPRADPRSWLESAGEDAGLRVGSCESTAAEAVERISRGRPLVRVLRDAEGRPQVTTLVRARGGRVLVDQGAGTRWVALGELEAELGLSPGQRATWLFGDPASPCADAVSPEGGPALAPLVRLVRLFRPDRGDLLAIFAFAAATGVLLLATPIAVQALVNFVALGGVVQQLVVVALFLFLGLGFAGVLTALQYWVVEILQRRIFVRVVAELASRLPRVRQETYDEGYGPERLNRFFDVVTLQKVGSYLLLDGLSVLLSVLVGTLVLAFYHPVLLAFDIVLLVVVAALVFLPARRGMRSAIAESSAKYEVAAWLEEIARNPMLFKASGARRWALEHADRLASRYVKARASHYRVVFSQMIGALGLQALASTALLAIGGWLVIGGTLTLGQLVAAELIVSAVVSSVAKMGKHLESFYDLTASVAKVGGLLDLPTERMGGEHHGPLEGTGGAALRLAGVAWHLPDGAALFEGLDVRVPAGGRLGVTGRSGSGKSTLVELLWGLRPPSAGHVDLDDRDVRDLSLDHLRQVVGVAGRIEIVTGTLRENVRLGRPYVDDEAVRAALQAVGLLERVKLLPDGLDTALHPVGHLLSDGEVRLLMIARAIAGSPRLLVVEDLLDGMSATRRATALAGLTDARAGWTLILVSNVPEVLARCEQVLELPRGGLRGGTSSPSQSA